MYLLISAVTALFAFSMSTPAADTPPVEIKERIRLIPVSRTPEPSTAELTIAIPRKGVVLTGNPVWVQFRLDGYPLETASQFDRANEIAKTDMGQTVHVVIDNFPYFPIYEPVINPFNEDGYFWDQSYKFEVPFSLKDGMHTIRVFPARSYGESLKGERTFHSSYFYLGDRSGNEDMDLSGPFMTYNEPSDELYLTEDKPILVDFYLTNCELSTDGYKVRLLIDGKIKRTLVSWQPYYLYGLKKGKHTIHMELIDSRNKRVPGLFNDNHRIIHVH